MTVLTCLWLVAYLFTLGMDHFMSVYEYPFVSFFLLLWLIGMIVVSRNKEWGRKLIVVTSVFMCFYLMADMAAFDVYSIALILIFVVIIVFYILPKTKAQFQVNDGILSKGHNRKILVVDDDKGLLKMIRSQLMYNGFDVITADTGEKGLSLAKTKKPDLIILDVILPGMKGRQVCAQLKRDSDTKNIPVLFLTAKDSPDDVKAELEAGAVTHLTKPVDLKKLLTEVIRILAL